MGLFIEKKPQAVEKPDQEMTDAYEAIAALYEQMADLAAKIGTLEGGAK